MTELERIFDHLDQACCPEDVFGAGSDLAGAFRKLARACHPDLHPGDPMADKVFQKLNALKVEADDRVKQGLWGKRVPLSRCLPIEIGSYRVNARFLKGDIADLYRGKDVWVKVSRSHDDNDLLRAEAKALTLLKTIPPPVNAGIPALETSFRLDGVWKREVNVLTAFPGFVTAEQVRQKMVVEARTAVWMFKRMLAVLSWTHHLGLVHGAILPPHVLFYPDNDGKKERDARKHSVRLIDWCYSVDFKARTRLSSWVPAWKEHYAPELLSKKALGPAADLYMAASLIWYLTESLPRSLEMVLVRCLDKDPEKRFQKATDVLEAWSKAAMAEFGSPRWQEFNLPA
jgi:hypothetical protein